VGAPRTTAYNYNAFNQVTDATDPDGMTLFTWDGNGNQTARTTPAESTAYTWDARDRLAEIALPDGTTATYGYDTENLRVSMDDADGARRILLDGLEEWGEVDDGTGELVGRFDHDPTRIDALLAQATGADGHVTMLTDALGSVYGLADDAAAVRARYGYDVYGARSASLEEIGTRWGFTGRTMDASVVFSRMRFMDPRLAAFLSADPAQTGRTLDPDEFAATASAFYYANARPTLMTDPMGRVPVLSAVLNTVAGVALLYAGVQLILTSVEHEVTVGGGGGGIAELGALYFLGGLFALTLGVARCASTAAALEDALFNIALRILPPSLFGLLFSAKIITVGFICIPRALNYAVRFGEPSTMAFQFAQRLLSCSVRAWAVVD
jgi:RHS repeat-associated protein